jgi:hypothetical protein
VHRRPIVGMITTARSGESVNGIGFSFRYLAASPVAKRLRRSSLAIATHRRTVCAGCAQFRSSTIESGYWLALTVTSPRVSRFWRIARAWEMPLTDPNITVRTIPTPTMTRASVKSESETT